MDRPERTLFARYSGASSVFSDPGPAGVIVRAEFFGTPAPVEYLYIGPSARSTRYLGAKTDAEIYLGPRALFPPEGDVAILLEDNATWWLMEDGVTQWLAEAASPAPDDAIMLEDGLTVWMLEDGTTPWLVESLGTLPDGALTDLDDAAVLDLEDAYILPPL